MDLGTIEALTEILDQSAAISDALVACAVDANTAGDRSAVCQGKLAAELAVVEAAVAPDPQYERKVIAPRTVQPKDVKPPFDATV